MTPMDLSLFGNDPWFVSLIKAVALLVYLLLWALFCVVFERKVVAKMQHRMGPNMNGPNGWGQSLGDGVKLMVKEDFRPKNTDKVVFNLAPILVAIPAFSVLSVIPFGGTVTIGDITTNLQLADTPVSVLIILSLASVGIYGIVLAGWSSGSTYSLLGGLRSSAQMISYEIAMGLSFVAVFMYSGSMATSDIVAKQQEPLSIFQQVELPVEGWFWLQLMPSFIIYVIAMVGETNRAPFDLPECEGELVGGFHTEYSGFRFAMFFLAEYINMVNVGAVATTLFLGGPSAPFAGLLNMIPVVGPILTGPWFGIVWLTLKIVCFVFFFVWLRGTLPRFRYDQFMNLGWKWLIPLSLGWIIAVATFKSIWNHNFTVFSIIGVVLVLGGLLALTFMSGEEPEEEDISEPNSEFDPYAGGFPVPPMPGQTLPEYAGVLAGESVPRSEGATRATSNAEGAES